MNVPSGAALGACVVILTSCKPPPPPEPSGEAVFASVCARCHGAEGHGGPPNEAGVKPRDFHDAAFQARLTDVQLRQTVIHGKDGNMPAFEEAFTEAQLDGLVAKVRSFSPKEARR